MPEYDLAALRLHLGYVLDNPTHLSQHMGRAVQRLFLEIVGEPLASTIHPEDDESAQQERPYTVSGLLRQGWCAPLFGGVARGDRAWIRLTGLNAEVTAALDRYRSITCEQLGRGEAVYAEINFKPWQVIAVEWDDHTLPGRFSYAQLIDRQRYSRPASRIGLNFAAATTFRSQGVNLPLPLPYLVFGSLVTRWQAFTSLRLRDLPDEQVDAFVKHHVLLSQYRGETSLYRFKERGKEVGFAGSAQFELARSSDHLQKHDPALEALLRKEYIWFARTMALMADFAYFSGIGRKTTAGMGLVRG